MLVETGRHATVLFAQKGLTVMPVSENVVADADRFRQILQSLQEFDTIEVLPVVKGLLTPTDREHCFLAAYYRSLTGVRTLVMLKDPSHFQAVAMLARGLFELAVDVRLIHVMSDSINKLYAYCRTERLRVARSTVAVVKAGKAHSDISLQEGFIASEGPTIDAEHQKFWPKAKKVVHWSGMNLKDRTLKLGSPYEETYDLSYAQLSWDVHPGLAGVLNLDANAFPAKCGLAFSFASDWYIDLLKVVTHELKIDKAVEKLNDKIRLAKMLPMAESPEQAEQFRDVMLR